MEPGWSKRSQMQGFAAAQPSGVRQTDERRRTWKYVGASPFRAGIIPAPVKRNYHNRLLWSRLTTDGPFSTV